MNTSIFLIGEQKNGTLKRVTFEGIAECHRKGVEPTVVIVGDDKIFGLEESLSRQGVKNVVFLHHPDLGDYAAEPHAQALYDYLQSHHPAAILTGATSQGKDLLPRVAAKFQVAQATDCTEITSLGTSTHVRRPVYAGKCSEKVTFLKSPAMFSYRPNAFAVSDSPPAPTAPQVEKVEVLPKAPLAKKTGVKASQAKKIELSEADRIISGGRSLKSSANFKILEDCASIMGAAVGASRAAVDAGYAPHDMQVGQTGKTVSPKLYIACGISGAIQHLAGMRTSKVIVAINTDPEAPIFQKADYGIVGDLFVIVPLLTEELKKLKH